MAVPLLSKLSHYEQTQLLEMCIGTVFTDGPGGAWVEDGSLPDFLTRLHYCHPPPSALYRCT